MSGKASRNKPQKKSRNKARINRLRPLAGVLAAGMCLPGLAAAQSKEYPTYVTGPQKNGSWVVSDGAVITPAGTQVDLGIRVRAKAIALNPSAKSHTAAVLTLGAAEAVEIFDTNTGIVLQNYARLRNGFERQLQRHSLFGGRQVPGVQPGQQQCHDRQSQCAGLAGR